MDNLFFTIHFILSTNPYWARVVGCGPFSLWIILKEGLWPSSGDIKRLMMMTHFIIFFTSMYQYHYFKLTRMCTNKCRTEI
jgi:hypothetical protein